MGEFYQLPLINLQQINLIHCDSLYYPNSESLRLPPERELVGYPIQLLLRLLQ